MALTRPDAPTPVVPPINLSAADKARALLRFTRPHTVIATTCQVIGVFVIVAGAAGFGRGLAALLWAWLGSQAVNLYVVGLNQLVDVPIDRLNKPYLPLAGGELSRREGVALVGVAGVAALVIGAGQSAYLFLVFAVVMLLGTVYSVPPLRLKGRPVWAAVSIALARGVVANLGLYLHFHRVLHSLAAEPPVWALFFFFGFGLVIALFKDIPDRDGDDQHNVRTLTVRWGPERVFNLGRGLLTVLYLAAIGAAWRWSSVGGVVVAGQAAALALFWALSLRTDPAQPRSMMRLYLALWGLFYAEYALLAVSALL
jgi:homogentisate phytyltransferase/homogentisate geranylgeranyltransferase